MAERGRRRDEKSPCLVPLPFMLRSHFERNIACVASVPVLHERNSGRAKDFFAFEPRENGARAKTWKKGVGEGKRNRSPPPLPSPRLFALAPTFAQPFCSRPIIRAARMRKIRSCRTGTLATQAKRNTAQTATEVSENPSNPLMDVGDFSLHL